MTKIYCRTTEKGVQTFYLSDGSQDYFLFSQDYRVSVKDYFKHGVSLDIALNAKSNHSTAVRKTAQKLVSYIKYMESESNITIFDKRRDKKNFKSKNKPYSRAKSNIELLSYYAEIA